jgi:hypothetical protein
MRRLFCAFILLLTALPSFAGQPNPTKRQRELIEKLLVAMNVNRTGASAMDAVLGQMQKQYLDGAAAKGNSPEDIAEAKEMFADFRQRAGKIDIGGLLREAQIVIFAKYFNEQELADLTAFYESATGRKSIEVMPQMMTEGMQAGAQYLGPVMEKVMAEVSEEQEKKHPWRRTMTELRWVATALEAYQTDQEGETYPAGDYESLKAILTPQYLKDFPEKDIWGHAYAYVVSEDRKHYRLVSAGADTNFEWDSRRIVAAKPGETVVTTYRERLEDDLIYQDGSFVQLPVQAKPQPNKVE